MKGKKLILTIIIALVLITAVLSILHLTTRTQGQSGALQISYKGEISSLPLDRLPLSEVTGSAVNGKGEVKEIDGRGTSVYEVLALAGIAPEEIQKVIVRADDEFYAELSREDVLEEGRAYLLSEEDEERPRLVVFGDPDSKRRVKDIVRLEVE